MHSASPSRGALGQIKGMGRNHSARRISDPLPCFWFVRYPTLTTHSQVCRTKVLAFGIASHMPFVGSSVHLLPKPSKPQAEESPTSIQKAKVDGLSLRGLGAQPKVDLNTWVRLFLRLGLPFFCWFQGRPEGTPLCTIFLGFCLKDGASDTSMALYCLAGRRRVRACSR